MSKVPVSLKSRLRLVAAFVYDFDGVMTDNRVLVFSDGSEAVFCNRADGWGVAQLKKMGYRQSILSTETNPVVARRAKKLGLPFIQGARDKGAAFFKYMATVGLRPEQVAYVGNDVNDLPAMKHAGFKIAPQDASREILAIADWITEAKGGFGVIYEIFKAVHSLKFAR